MKTKSSLLSFLTTLPGIALAAIILTGSVFALVTAPYTINLGGLKVNEQRIFTLFYMNTTATSPINLTTACDTVSFAGTISLPVGSTQTQPITWNTAGLTILPANITAGIVQGSIQALKQGTFNCTLSVDGGSNLNITYTTNPL